MNQIISKLLTLQSHSAIQSSADYIERSMPPELTWSLEGIADVEPTEHASDSNSI